jgi:hypothetical protein
MRLEVNPTTEGTTARIAPVTLTPTGMEILRNKNDLWTFNSQGFLVRVHRTQRKALFMPDSRCPVPTGRLENYRRTVIQRPNNNTEVIEEAYQDLDKKQQKRVIQGHNWTGETWFKVNRGTPLPGNIPPQPALPPATGPTPATSRQLYIHIYTYKYVHIYIYIYTFIYNLVHMYIYTRYYVFHRQSCPFSDQLFLQKFSAQWHPLGHQGRFC